METSLLLSLPLVIAYVPLEYALESCAGMALIKKFTIGRNKSNTDTLLNRYKHRFYVLNRNFRTFFSFSFNSASAATTIKSHMELPPPQNLPSQSFSVRLYRSCISRAVTPSTAAIRPMTICAASLISLYSWRAWICLSRSTLAYLRSKGR